MNWPGHVQALARGDAVTCRPRGNSMSPRIRSGQLVTIAPDVSVVRKGDVVFCKVGGHFYVHLVSAVGNDGRLQISSNHGRVNGWTRAVYGKVVDVKD